MKLYVDLESLQLIEGPGFRNPVTSLRFKRGDAAKLEVTFLDGGTTAVSIGDPTLLELRFGVKPRNRYDIGYLVQSDAWTMPTLNAENPFYQSSPSFNTEELNSALGLGSATGSELSEITLMGEITWREGTGEPTSTRTFLVVVENDVNRGTEGVPISAEPAYPTASNIELITRKGQPDGYVELDEYGLVPANRIRPMHGIQLTDHGVAVGYGSSVDSSGSVIGVLASGVGVSVGFNSMSHEESVAIGGNSMATLHGIALGSYARTEGANCIAIGYGVVTGEWDHGIGRLEIAPNGITGPRFSGHMWNGTNLMQFSVMDGHGGSPTAMHGGSAFNHTPGTLPHGMMMFSYTAGNLTIYVNDSGTLKTATLPMA